MADVETRISRLAPSPTGALHLGNARTFLINWAMARQQGWRLIMRIEDLDGPRVKPGVGELVMEQLRWLGIDWDGEPVWQSHDLTPYQRALEVLRGKGLLYPCRCTRKEIEQAQSAPHADEHELRYPGTCRPRGDSGGRHEDRASHATAPPLLDEDMTTAWRVVVPDEIVTFHDMIRGEQRMNVQEQVGDFIVATKNGQPAYQLAVVVDDARQGVTDVVRGDDLLHSAARQMLLYRMLDLAPAAPGSAPGNGTRAAAPRPLNGRSGCLESATSDIKHQTSHIPIYWHLPLIVGADGRRLAKRHGDTRLLHYRERGVPADVIIGLLATWCGITDRRRAMSADEFADRFDLARLPRGPVTFTDEDEAWLQSMARS